MADIWSEKMTEMCSPDPPDESTDTLVNDDLIDKIADKVVEKMSGGVAVNADDSAAENLESEE